MARGIRRHRRPDHRAPEAPGAGGEDDGNKADEALSSNSDLSDIPAIDLQAKQFLLYGKTWANCRCWAPTWRRWRLDKLSIANDAAKLDAKGDWTLDASRGLTVDAAIKFANLGGFMDRIGFEKMVSGGDGTMQGRMTWRNLPWTHNIADIDGEVEVSVDKGRFMHVNCARRGAGTAVAAIRCSAWPLEANPTSLLRDGFPFDTIRGHMRLSDGVLRTDGYKVNGPWRPSCWPAT